MNAADSGEPAIFVAATTSCCVSRLNVRVRRCRRDVDVERDAPGNADVGEAREFPRASVAPKLLEPREMRMSLRWPRLLAVLGLTISPGFAASLRDEPAIEVHYAPAENLERLDAALIASARQRIDLAAYTLTDRAVLDALIEARRRGVLLRIVLDPSESQGLDQLRLIAAAVRMKPPGPFMHLKSYLVDGRTLRSGSANLSASGLKRQDNDLVLMRDPNAAAAFEKDFERIWAAAGPLRGADAGGATGTGRRKGCAIKGNVSRAGDRVYHLPGSRDYGRVRMDKGLGERWFCSEREATVAGWRRAGRR